MEDIFAFYNRNSKSDKLFIDDSNFLNNIKLSINDSKFYSNNKFSSNYFGNNNIKMANNTKILYINFSNILLNFCIIN